MLPRHASIQSHMRVIGFVALATILIASPSHATSAVDETWVAGTEKAMKALLSSESSLEQSSATVVDADNAVDTQLELNRQKYEEIKDMTPGVILGQIATNVRSLAASTELARSTKLSLSSLMLNRELAHIAGENINRDYDAMGRLTAYHSIYCNPQDNDGNAPCKEDPPSDTTRYNRDIDYSNLFGNSLTLDLDFADGQMTTDEQDLTAFMNNISSNKTLGPQDWTQQSGVSLTQSVGNYQDFRSITAKRGMVRNSLTNLASSRAKGAPGSADYMNALLQRLGGDGSAESAKKYLQGSASAPSYYAQMEVLAKKTYQDPDFFKNLMEGQTNAERTQAAIGAIRLMQRHDMYETTLRRELLLSQLLEATILEYEKSVAKRTARAITDN